MRQRPLANLTTLAVTVAIAACSSSSPSSSTTALPSESPVVSSAPASQAPASPTAQVLPVAGDLFPGTYAPLFEPSITFTVGDAVNLDCAPNYECRGEVDADEPGWVALDFGHDHGSELLIMRIDEVVDAAQPPADLAQWISTRPGVTLVEGPAAVTIGGLPAKRIEFQTGDPPVEVGPIPGVEDPGAGFPPDDHRLAYVVNVRGQWVLISVGFDANNVVHNYEETVAALQPIIDSIDWP